MPNISVVEVGGLPGAHAFLWETLTENDTALPLVCPHRADMSVHVLGTFNGGTLVIAGSNIVTSPSYITLVDQSDNALSFTAAGLEAIAANVWQIRPRITAGATMDLDIYIFIATGGGF